MVDVRVDGHRQLADPDGDRGRRGSVLEDPLDDRSGDALQQAIALVLDDRPRDLNERAVVDRVLEGVAPGGRG